MRQNKENYNLLLNPFTHAWGHKQSIMNLTKIPKIFPDPKDCQVLQVILNVQEVPQISKMSCHIITRYNTTNKLVVGQTLFKFDGNLKGDKMRWRCVNRSCKYSIHTVNGEIVKRLNPVHMGILDCSGGHLAGTEKLLGTMEELALTTLKPIENIIYNSYATAHCDWECRLPSFENIRKHLFKIRHRESVLSLGV